MQIHLKFFLLKEDLYARSLGCPLGCSKEFDFRAFLVSWEKEQSTGWVPAARQPFLHLAHGDAHDGSWKDGLHAPPNGMGQMMGCLP